MSGQLNQSSAAAHAPGPSAAVGDGRAVGRATPIQQKQAKWKAAADYTVIARNRLKTAIKLLFKQPIPIRLFGDAHCSDVYRAFTSRHPKLPIFQKKSFGAALRDLRVPVETAFDGPAFATCRRAVRRAERSGYRVVMIDPALNLDHILRINASTETRQGRRMLRDYLDRNKVAEYIAEYGTNGSWYGVIDARGDLTAYCHLMIVGECCLYSRILGESRNLNDGIMYLLIEKTVLVMHQFFHEHGYPKWVMYDMYLGGRHGLREFKRRTGFCPERVTWIWSEKDGIP